MRGTTLVRFSDLFADTVSTHGADWARKHYTRNGMAEWEFDFWMKGIRNG